MPPALLQWDARPPGARAVVLVLHGGAAHGYQVTRPWSHAALRLVPISRALARRVPGPLAVARLRFAVRGWNGPERSPVADARWALEQLRARYPGRPVALVGHSMGGRTAIHLADDPGVRLLVGLAPWIERGDPVPPGTVKSVFLHGDRDRICPLGATRWFVERLQQQGRDASLVRVVGSDHAMLLRARVWTELVTGIVGGALAEELGQGHPGRPGPVGDVVASVLAGGGVVTQV